MERDKGFDLLSQRAYETGAGNVVVSIEDAREAVAEARREEAARWAENVRNLLGLSAALTEGGVHFRKMAEALLREVEEGK